MAIRTNRESVAIVMALMTLNWALVSASSCPFSGDGDHDHTHDHHGHGHPGHGHSHSSAQDDSHSHAHIHHHKHQGHHHDHHGHDHEQSPADGRPFKLAEELAEEEELKLYGFASHSHFEEHHHHHHNHDHSEHIHADLGLWLRALGCSLLVSMASLICLIILPLILAKGRPSRGIVDFLAAFGAGAMLGDAFLHQLPHALGGSGGHSHSHDHHHSEGDQHGEGGGHSHAHSIQDLSVGLAVLAGILLFFIVEKIVRQVEKSSSKGSLPWSHHHHHHHGHTSKHEEEDEATEGSKQIAAADTVAETPEKSSTQDETKKDKMRRRNKKSITKETNPLQMVKDKSELTEVEKAAAPNLILGYLNLFSDGVHNFTDGMALGSAFLNHGTIGGWSRTLFLLAHEIPQEVGDFGILVQSGFTVFKALAFNFLSALVALAGTALALLLGGSPEHSSLIEGFTAGGFIYIAVAGVLPEMHQSGTSAKITLFQLVALGLGMSIALVISLVE